MGYGHRQKTMGDGVERYWNEGHIQTTNIIPKILQQNKNPTKTLKTYTQKY